MDVPMGATNVRTLAASDALEHIAQHGRREAWPVLRQLVDVVNLVDAAGEDAAAELASRNRNVRVALGTASFLAPWLGDLVDLDRSTKRCCLEAWNGCLALDRRLDARRALTGRAALRARIAHESWLLRSAPNWATRVAYGTRLAVPLRTLVDSRVRPWPGGGR
jgi:hypothetical protein